MALEVIGFLFAQKIFFHPKDLLQEDDANGKCVGSAGMGTAEAAVWMEDSPGPTICI